MLNMSNARMRIRLELARDSILEDQDNATALHHLRVALRHAKRAGNSKAWSKIMLALRELGRTVCVVQ